MLGAGLFAGAINFSIGMVLVPDKVSADDLGALSVLIRMLALGNALIVMVTFTASKYCNVFHVREQTGRIRAFVRDLLVFSSGVGLLYAGIVLAFRHGLQERMKFSDPRVVLALMASVAITPLIPVLDSIARGLMRFRAVVVASLALPVVKLCAMLALLGYAGLLGYMTAGFLATAVMAAIYLWSLRFYWWGQASHESYRSEWVEMLKYLRSAGGVAVLMGLCGTVEALAVRNFTSRMDSAGFYIAMTFGQMPFFLSGVILPFLMPMVSSRHERGERSLGLTVQAMVVMLVLGGCMALALAILGRPLLMLRASWRQYAEYAPYVWRLTLIFTLQGVNTAYSNHESACRRFAFIPWYVVVTVLEMACVYSFLGWSAFRNVLPAGVWEWGLHAFAGRLNLAVRLMLWSRIILTFYALVRIVRGWREEGAADVSATDVAGGRAIR